MKLQNIFLLACALCIAPPVFAMEPGLWTPQRSEDMERSVVRDIVPQQFKTYRLNLLAAWNLLRDAPPEDAGSRRAEGAVFEIPLPNGRIGNVSAWESSIMAPELAERFPEIRTYLLQGNDGYLLSGRLDWTPSGLHAILFTIEGTLYIDPYSRSSNEDYISYFKGDFISPRSGVRYPPEIVDPQSSHLHSSHGSDVESTAARSGEQLITYRLAVATTGEYTTYHGGTVASGMAAVVTAVNRVSAIYERELAARLQLIANNDQIIYTDAATDPYNNYSPSALLSQNQSNLDAVIGSANYDVGHVFSTGGGGLAALAVVCSNSSKARGETGLSNPIGDPFYVDFVAHEIGHQFGGNHTFNGSEGNCSGSNRNAATAYEPGSGSTIQAYAGICGSQNLQSNSDDYFHTISYQEMRSHITAGSGSTCGSTTATGNTAPVITVPAGGFTIPGQTPFKLSGSATDINGDTLTYSWEQFDLGAAGHPDSPVDSAPRFRSFLASSSGERIFPKLSDILTSTHTIGEILPDTDITMNFRLTVRDNRAGGGGVDYDSISFDVDGDSGPFVTTAPAAAASWSGNSNETVAWNVANTNNSPVNCPLVDIHLSSDDGANFNQTLISGTANDGSEMVAAPQVTTSTARIQVACSDNVFFAISPSFSITATSTTPTALDIDGNGVDDALTDGLLVIRYLFGFRGATLIDHAIGAGCTRCTSDDIESYLAQLGLNGELDIDGNGIADALTDGLLVIRYLFGFRGATLIDQAVSLGNCTRCDSTDIEGFLGSL